MTVLDQSEIDPHFKFTTQQYHLMHEAVDFHFNCYFVLVFLSLRQILALHRYRYLYKFKPTSYRCLVLVLFYQFVYCSQHPELI